MEFLADIHTKVVHFPIALLITYSLLEVIGIVFNKKLFTQSAYILLIIGVITLFLSVLTGNQAFEAYQYWNDDSSKIFNSHQLFANITIWFFLFVTIARTFLVIKQKFQGAVKYLFIIFAIAGIFFIYKTAQYGGELINEFGVGTKIKNEQMQNNF